MIASMTQAEVAEVTASAADFGYGPEENARRGLTGDAKLYIRAELVGIEKERDNWDLSVAEKLERSLQYKEIGNTYFKSQQFRRAQRQYKEVRRLLCVAGLRAGHPTGFAHRAWARATGFAHRARARATGFGHRARARATP